MYIETESQQIEETLSQSIEQYGTILDFLEKMDKEVGTASPSELLELSSSLTDLQGLATQTDHVLLTQLSTDPAKNDNIQNLIDKREHLVKHVLLLNEHITAKATGVKSLIAHELGKLRNGLSALTGYRQQQNNHGRIVNSSS